MPACTLPQVVKARGEAMAAAAAVPPGGRAHGMLSVVGLEDDPLQALCDAAIAELEPGTVCRLANFLFPQGRVVSGHEDALERVALGALQAGALKASRLPVSGAFHTPLMAPARDALMQVRYPSLSHLVAANSGGGVWDACLSVCLSVCQSETRLRTRAAPHTLPK